MKKNADVNKRDAQVQFLYKKKIVDTLIIIIDQPQDTVLCYRDIIMKNSSAWNSNEDWQNTQSFIV